MDLFVAAATLAAVAAAFGVSASVGLGGSLILVPALALPLGTKNRVALAALLIAGNNVVKVVVYRKTLPFRRSAVKSTRATIQHEVRRRHDRWADVAPG